MEPFINRESELRLIDSALSALLDRERLLLTPIVNFYGIKGIGKTRVLKEAIQMCHTNQVPCIDLTVNHDQVMEQSLLRIKLLLQQGPLVMLFDSVDAMDERQIAQLEEMLGELLLHNNLLVVLASNGSLSFKHDRSVERKLTTCLLEPLDRSNCDLYLDHLTHTLQPEERGLIFEWTRGYPLAMKIMSEAMLEQGIDPTLEQGRNALITSLIEQVVDQGILAHVPQDELSWFQTTLRLLAVPRRFNLAIMQRLIEYFEPSLKLANSLSYIVLPKRIAQATGILDWNVAKAGFALNDSIRRLLLLYLEFIIPERYYDVHRFLAEINWSSTIDVSASDRMRYQIEYFYHSILSVAEGQRSSMLQQALMQILQDERNTFEQLLLFREAFVHDRELNEILATDVVLVLDTVDLSLAQLTCQLIAVEHDEEKRLAYMRDFFSFIVRDTAILDLPEDMRQQVHQLLNQESQTTLLKLKQELAQQGKLSAALEATFPMLFGLEER